MKNVDAIKQNIAVIDELADQTTRIMAAFNTNSNKKYDLMIHEGTHDWARAGIWSERIIGKYSPYAFDIHIFLNDDRMYTITENGFWTSNNPEQIAELKSREENYRNSLPTIDRQEVHPVFSMIDSINFTPDIICAYLGDDPVKQIDLLSSSDKSTMVRVEPKTVSDALKHQQRKKKFMTMPIQVAMIDDALERGDTLCIFDGSMEWALHPSFAVVMDKHLNPDYVFLGEKKLAEFDKKWYHLFGLKGSIDYENVIQDPEGLGVTLALMEQYVRRARYADVIRLTDIVLKANTLVLEKTHSMINQDYDPKKYHATLMNNYGYALMGLKRFDESIAAFQLGIDTHEQMFLNNNLATALQTQFKYEDAIRYYRRELEVNPGHETAKRSLDRIDKILN
jgi:hypothetical protein